MAELSSSTINTRKTLARSSARPVAATGSSMAAGISNAASPISWRKASSRRNAARSPLIEETQALVRRRKPVFPLYGLSITLGFLLRDSRNISSGTTTAAPKYGQAMFHPRVTCRPPTDGMRFLADIRAFPERLAGFPFRLLCLVRGRMGRRQRRFPIALLMAQIIPVAGQRAKSQLLACRERLAHQSASVCARLAPVGRERIEQPQPGRAVVYIAQHILQPGQRARVVLRRFLREQRLHELRRIAQLFRGNAHAMHLRRVRCVEAPRDLAQAPVALSQASRGKRLQRRRARGLLQGREQAPQLKDKLGVARRGNGLA